MFHILSYNHSFVTELTQLIRAKSSPREDKVKDSSEFVGFFPDFIWAVRDFALELKLNGRPITEDEYLENALKLIQGTSGRGKLESAKPCSLLDISCLR